MKKSQLKELIKQIIKEALTEQPVGGVKNDRPFDDGRHNVMMAVNVGEMVGDDGRYQDDMESGAAVKKLHNLNEMGQQKFIYPVNFRTVKNYIRILKKTATGEFVVYWYENGKKNENKSYFTDDKEDAIGTFNAMKSHVDKVNSGMNEMTSTGAVAGYATPFAFSKKGSGSKRALDVTKRMGYTKVKDISEDTR